MILRSVTANSANTRVDIMVVNCVRWLILLVVGGTLSAPQGHDHDSRLLRYVNNNNGYGTYSFEFETSNGIYRHEDGASRDDGPVVVRGEYRYVDPEGGSHVVQYVADENGYRTLPESTDTRFNDRRLI